MITEPGFLPEAARTINASGKHVIPGGIDTHVHYRDPGHWERETFEVGTRAAAAGGCTTFFEHPISIPPQWNGKILKDRISICKGEDSPANDRHEKGSCVDFCFFGAAGGQHPEAIEPLADEGIVAYKTFLHDAPEGRDAEFEGLTSANNDQLYRVLEEVKNGEQVTVVCGGKTFKADCEVSERQRHALLAGGTLLYARTRTSHTANPDLRSLRSRRFPKC